jgi:NAD(P) transhydrogenase
MLDMFRRSGDPPDYNYLFAIPAALFIGGFTLSNLAGNHPPSSTYFD